MVKTPKDIKKWQKEQQKGTGAEGKDKKKKDTFSTTNMSESQYNQMYFQNKH